jgi:hypothetical protein
MARAAMCVPARIAGARDEAELFGARGKGRRARRCEANDHEHAARHRPHSARSHAPRCIDQSPERGRIGVTESEPDAARQRAVAQPMRANSLAPFSFSCGGRKLAEAACAGEGRAKWRETFRGEHLARARVAATPRNNVEQADGGFDATRAGDDPEFDCARAVTGDADVKRRARVAHFRAKAHVGGNVVEVETSAAVDDDRDLGRDRCTSRSARKCSAQIAGERARVEHLFRIESGKRVAENGNAVRRRNLQRGDRRCEARR